MNTENINDLKTNMARKMENQIFLLSVWNDALIMKTNKCLSYFKNGVKI